MNERSLANARLFLILSTLFFTLAQTSVKFIPEIPAHEIVFFRSILSGALTFFFIRRAGLSPWGTNRKMLILRGLLGSGAMVLYFWTLQSIPLASAMTLHYLYPVLTVLFAAILTSEKPTRLQWICLGTSFLGVCLIKGFDARIGLGALLIAFLSALMDAGTFTIIRALRREDHALVVIFYLPLVSTVGLAPYTLTHFVAPSGLAIAVIVLIGIFAQLGQYFVTRAYQLESAASIANLNYLSPILALLAGYAIWDETISSPAILGVLIIAASASISAWKTRPRSVDQTMKIGQQ